ncbi:MAG: diaminopimelate epimerase [Saccharofermentanales bacterium]
MKFYKMHGIGNDYIYIDCFQEKVDNPGELAIKLSDRHFGIGGDGIVLILPSDIADCKMDMYNADGSQGRMCGNAIRCVAKYLFDQGLVEEVKVAIETLSGVKQVKLNFKGGTLADVTVDMGEPGLSEAYMADGSVIEQIEAGGETYEVTNVSMGNPHAVVFVDDVDSTPVEKIGRAIENHPCYPDRTNVEFVEVIDDSTIKMRVWERGSGETLACGTGACASVVASALNGRTKRDACVKLRGGDLKISWDEAKNIVMMTGAVKKVFYGFVEPKEL